MAAVAYFWKAEEDFGHETKAQEQLGQEGRQSNRAEAVEDHVLNASCSPVGSPLAFDWPIFIFQRLSLPAASLWHQRSAQGKLASTVTLVHAPPWPSEIWHMLLSKDEVPLDDGSDCLMQRGLGSWAISRTRCKNGCHPHQQAMKALPTSLRSRLDPPA